MWQPAHFDVKSLLPVRLVAGAWRCRPCRSRPPQPARQRERAEERLGPPHYAGGALPVGSQLRDRLVARRVDREDAVETGDLEDLRDVPVAADERELAVVRRAAA